MRRLWIESSCKYIRHRFTKSVKIASKLGGDKRYLSMLNTYSDAGEFPLELNLDGKQTIVQTVDSISQMISDPFVFGRIAALHALSDLAVSNVIPLTALSMINIQRAKRNLQDQIYKYAFRCFVRI
ncbi:MAG: hypothetical protein CM15mP117_21760 [Alphaproteobacteria bacterium]|nr:MAG: hypothetical protein CM15mP117_21760 [Alphaproteobacteria bacterium]